MNHVPLILQLPRFPSRQAFCQDEKLTQAWVFEVKASKSSFESFTLYVQLRQRRRQWVHESCLRVVVAVPDGFATGFCMLH